MLAREAMENRNLRDRLLLEAAQSNPAGFDITAYRRSIASATRRQTEYLFSAEALISFDVFFID